MHDGARFRNVPSIPEVPSSQAPKKKPPEGGLYILEIAFDQAVRIANLRRRFAMKPTPAKPRSIIAQVEGSGTAPTAFTDNVGHRDQDLLL